MLNKIKTAVTLMALMAVLTIPLTGFAADSNAININTATKIELRSIKGIGPKMAEKIVSYREQHGQFSQVADLCNVKGIGEKSVHKLADQVCVK